LCHYKRKSKASPFHLGQDCAGEGVLFKIEGKEYVRA